MKILLVFENSGDILEYEVIHNHELIQFFVETCDATDNNRFFNRSNLKSELDKLLTSVHWALSKTNEILPTLIGQEFNMNLNILDYLDQNFLNRQHAEWVFSQNCIIDIDELRFNIDQAKSKIGHILHEMYPDDIRKVRLAPILEKLGYLHPYEEVNMTVHRLESVFRSIEMSSDNKWDVFNNPYMDRMYSSNDISNLSISYTYVGRQYYNKFIRFDDNLDYKDHYNYETLEYSFHLSLEKPQTIPYSNEFTTWANDHSIPLISTSLPIANIFDISENLFKYRTILYRNFSSNNAAKLLIK